MNQRRELKLNEVIDKEDNSMPNTFYFPSF